MWARAVEIGSGKDGSSRLPSTRTAFAPHPRRLRKGYDRDTEVELMKMPARSEHGIRGVPMQDRALQISACGAAADLIAGLGGDAP